MKNVIRYYYNLMPEDIHFINDMYKFQIENKFYAFCKCSTNINVSDIYQLNQELLSKNIYNHLIILNNNDRLITNVDGKNYILFQLYNDMSEDISEDFIINFSNSTIGILKNQKLDWKEKWIKKIDYFEYQMSEIGKKYPIIRKNFSYYIGMTENAISLLNDINNVDFCVSHQRIKFSSTTFDLYNPLNFVLDTRIRDISEYLKSKFFEYNKDIYNDIIKYIENNNLNNSEIQIFFIRMLYPSYYFDMYEKILQGLLEEEEILKIVNLSNNYENILRLFYNYIKQKYNFFIIEWLEKKDW